MEAKLLPMQSFYNAKTNEFIGMIVPAGAIGTSHLKNPNIISIGMDSPEIQRASLQLRKLGLYPYFVNGDVIGTKKKYSSISYERTTTVGLSFSFREKSEDSLYLGENITYGIKMDWTPFVTSDMRTQKGMWLTDPISGIIQSGSILAKGETAITATQEVIRIAAVTATLEQRSNSQEWPDKDFSQLQTKKNYKNADVTVLSFNTETTQNLLLTEVTKAFNENYKTESDWGDRHWELNSQAPVWDDVLASTLVQNICDQMMSHLSIGNNFRPRCRVFADLKPYAFSYPGGDLFITAGFLAKVTNQDTLEFMIGHELGHILSRHFTKSMQNQEYYNKVMNTISLASSVLSFFSPTLATVAASQLPQWVRNISIENLYYGISTVHTDDNELESDRLGYELALSIGAQGEKIVEGLKSYDQLLDSEFLQLASSSQSQVRNQLFKERIGKIKGLAATLPSTVRILDQSHTLSDIQNKLKYPFEHFILSL